MDLFLSTLNMSIASSFLFLLVLLLRRVPRAIGRLVPAAVRTGRFVPDFSRRSAVFRAKCKSILDGTNRFKAPVLPRFCTHFWKNARWDAR